MAGLDVDCHDFVMKRNWLPAVTVLAAVLLTGACGAEGGPTSSSTSAEPKADLIEYEKDEPPNGVTISKPADIAKLKGAPDGFKQFIAGLVDASKVHPEAECELRVGVAKVDASGFALGDMALPSCDGAVFIWARWDGVWQEIFSGQAIPACSDMKKYSVPRPIAPEKCEEGRKTVDYPG